MRNKAQSIYHTKACCKPKYALRGIMNHNRNSNRGAITDISMLPTELSRKTFHFSSLPAEFEVINKFKKKNCSFTPRWTSNISMLTKVPTAILILWSWWWGMRIIFTISSYVPTSQSPLWIETPAQMVKTVKIMMPTWAIKCKTRWNLNPELLRCQKFEVIVRVKGYIYIY